MHISTGLCALVANRSAFPPKKLVDFGFGRFSEISVCALWVHILWGGARGFGAPEPYYKLFITDSSYVICVEGYICSKNAIFSHFPQFSVTIPSVFSPITQKSGCFSPLFLNLGKNDLVEYGATILYAMLDI